MSDRQVALYARVSTDQQARDHTIASQVALLRERIAADGGQLEPDHAYIDEATAARACCARRRSGCATRWPRGASSASTSMPRTGWPAARRTGRS